VLSVNVFDFADHLIAKGDSVDAQSEFKATRDKLTGSPT
jgi:hypothetical protein